MPPQPDVHNCSGIFAKVNGWGGHALPSPLYLLRSFKLSGLLGERLATMEEQ